MNRKILLPFTLLAAGLSSACAGNAYVVARTAPPPPRAVGFVGVAPGPGYVWVDGYWNWRNNWVWVPGSWVRPPRHRAVWVPGYWSQHGRNYRFHQGHWR
jgi:hypothetical protein